MYLLYIQIYDKVFVFDTNGVISYHDVKQTPFRLFVSLPCVLYILHSRVMRPRIHLIFIRLAATSYKEDEMKEIGCDWNRFISLSSASIQPQSNTKDMPHKGIHIMDN